MKRLVPAPARTLFAVSLAASLSLGAFTQGTPATSTSGDERAGADDDRTGAGSTDKASSRSPVVLAQLPRIDPRAPALPAAEPALTPDAPAVPGGPVHEVRAGETVSGIADRYGLDPAAVQSANALTDPASIRPGDVLLIPAPTPRVLASPRAAAQAGLPIEQVLEDAARTFEWNPALIKAIAWVESGWNERVRSTRGAVGVMQVLPETVAEVAERLGRALDPYDPLDNAHAGVAYLQHLWERTGGDLRRTLASYHQGPTGLREGGVGASASYIEQVLAARAVFAES